MNGVDVGLAVAGFGLLLLVWSWLEWRRVDRRRRIERLRTRGLM